MTQLNVLNETPRRLSWAGIIITDGCNFRCGMCDYWKVRSPKRLTRNALAPLATWLLAGGIEGVTITGGEPLINREWVGIAKLFSGRSQVNLSTNGSLLRANASDIGAHVSRVIVSIDGASRDTFKRIRGVDLFDSIWLDMEALKLAFPTLKVCVKMTIQRDNALETLDFLEAALARKWIDGVGFAIPDFSLGAFALHSNRLAEYRKTVIPDFSDLPRIRDMALKIVNDYKSLYESRYIFEGDLARYIQRFDSIFGALAPSVRNCTIPREVITVHPNGRISGCYFLPPDCSLNELSEESSICRLLERRRSFKSREHTACQSCDQLLFTNSRFECDPGGGRA